MVSNNRPSSAAPLTPTIASSLSGRAATDGHSGEVIGAVIPAANGSGHALGSQHRETASFAIGDLRLDLAAAPGGASLSVSVGDDRDVYPLGSATLDMWAESTARLLTLDTAANASERAEFRAPYLMDVDGRAAIAFECLVSERAVEYRLLVMGAAARVGVMPATAELVGSIVQAARGAVLLARLPAESGRNAV